MTVTTENHLPPSAHQTLADPVRRILALFARAAPRWARRGAAFTAVGDVGWAVGSVLLAATAGLPAWATVAVLAQALVTLTIGAAKRAALVATAPRIR